MTRRFGNLCMHVCRYLLCAAVLACEASEQIQADLNSIGSAIEFDGALQLKVGDALSMGNATIGGFVEIQNETRFDEGLLPNHRWRGVLSGTVSCVLRDHMQQKLLLFTGLEHESSHATMGIVESTEDPYEMIFDHRYRRCMLNALPLGLSYEAYDRIQRFVIRGYGAWYFLSKNTPELDEKTVGNSGGFAASALYRYQIGKRIGLFFSVHERFLFRGPRLHKGTVYVDENGELSAKTLDYPVVNRISTFSIASGVSLPLFRSRRLLSVYLRFLHGNLYGYVDSRDIRSRISVGMMVSGR